MYFSPHSNPKNSGICICSLLTIANYDLDIHRDTQEAQLNIDFDQGLGKKFDFPKIQVVGKPSFISSLGKYPSSTYPCLTL